MPSFYNVEVEAKSEFIEVDFHITVDEFLSECSLNEIDKMIDLLREDGFTFDKNVDPTKMSGVESLYEAALDKLHGKWNRLSKEEEDFILKLGSKF